MLRWKIEERLEQYYIEGDIDRCNVDAFCSALKKLPQGGILDMGELDIEDGVSMASIVSALRLLRPLVLVEAPQMLAHTLYKTHMLSTGITLVRPREDDDFRD